MNRTIHLKGQMGKLFGETHKLNVETIQEAMHAIDVMKGGLRRYIMECMDQGIHFTVQRGATVKEFTEENMDDFMGYDTVVKELEDDDIIITPIPAGANKAKEIVKIIVGAILIVASLLWDPSGTTGKAIAGIMFNVGVQLALSGIIALLTPDADDESETKTSIFNGPVNTTKVGVPIPLAYGKTEAGGVVTNFAFTRNRVESHAGYSKNAFGYDWNI